MNTKTKIVVIGGTGLIGTKLVEKLRAAGHEVIAASRSTGINAMTGEGLEKALQGATIVVDVANSPSFEDAAVMEFFETTTRNLLAVETVAGVHHHIALSVVGTDRLQGSGYFRAKLAQEKLIQSSPIPYTILRATQFFEFLDAIAQFSVVGDAVHLPHTLFQPVAAEDVAATLFDVVQGEPHNAILDLAGPDAVPMDELVRNYLIAKKDPRQVITDPAAHYFGLAFDNTSLRPLGEARLGKIRFEDWIK